MSDNAPASANNAIRRFEVTHLGPSKPIEYASDPGVVTVKTGQNYSVTTPDGRILIIRCISSYVAEADERIAEMEKALTVPIAWGVFYFGGKLNGRLYSQCETKDQAERYIADRHQSDDTNTFRCAPIFTAQPAAQAIIDGLTKERDDWKEAESRSAQSFKNAFSEVQQLRAEVDAFGHTDAELRATVDAYRDENTRLTAELAALTEQNEILSDGLLSLSPENVLKEQGYLMDKIGLLTAALGKARDALGIAERNNPFKALITVFSEAIAAIDEVLLSEES